MIETTVIRVDRTDLVAALGHTLHAIIKARNDVALTQKPITVLKWADFAEAIQTPAASMAQDLASPITHAEAMGILTLRWIGEQLFTLGGTNAMRDALEMAAEDDPYAYTMLDIADHRWNGIGSKSDIWCS